MLANLHYGSPEPKNIHEARQIKEWSKWWVACCTEFRNMEATCVWEVVDQKDIPPVLRFRFS
jgi:hypothetical protein